MLGSNPSFLSDKFLIGIPEFNYDIAEDILQSESLRDNFIVDYTHYSIVMSKSNRQAFISLCNLDQNQFKAVKGRRWFSDKRIGLENQLDNRYYKHNHWDRGHLTRRTAVTWGETSYIAKKASNDSCSYTNASLQHKNFNQDEWRIPEEIARYFDRDKNGKLSIMTGPLFTNSDRNYYPDLYNVEPARIPSGFWKVIYYIDKKKSKNVGKDVLGCEAYLVYQDNLSMRDMDGDKNVEVSTIQITISELMDLTGIIFQEELYNANPLWYNTEGRDIDRPEKFEIKVKGRSKGVKEGWAGHVIHDREDIHDHGFKQI